MKPDGSGRAVAEPLQGLQLAAQQHHMALEQLGDFDRQIQLNSVLGALQPGLQATQHIQPGLGRRLSQVVELGLAHSLQQTALIQGHG